MTLMLHFFLAVAISKPEERSYALLVVLAIILTFPAVSEQRISNRTENCTIQHTLDHLIYMQMDEEDLERVNNSQDPLCKPVMGNNDCNFQANLLVEWPVPALVRYMELFMNRTDVCDINLLQECMAITSPDGLVDYRCSCRPYSAQLSNSTDLDSPCVAHVGYPCAFVNKFGPNPIQDEALQISGKNYNCVPNAECIPLEDLSVGQNQSTRERVSDTAGYPPNDSRWPPPIRDYIIYIMGSVCACKDGFAHNGVGGCIDINSIFSGAISKKMPSEIMMLCLVAIFL